MKMRKTVLSLLSMSLACALGAGASALAPAVAVADETPIVAAAATDTVLVRFVTGTSADAATSAVRGLSTVQAKAIGKTDLEGYVTLSVADGHTADEAIAELESLDVVESAQKNYRYSLVDSERESLTSLVAMELPSTTVENPLVAQMQVSDPMVVDQWALTSMSVFDAWDTARCERSVTVALIDLGCDVTHEDLRDNIVTTHNSYAAVNGGDVNNVSPISVNFNHGTHVAGIIGAVTNNSIGVAGVSHNARILPIKVVNDAGDAYTNALVDAYQFILDNADAMNIRVVNISMGSKVDSIEDNAFTEMIDKAKAKGIVTVAAGGNRNDAGGWIPPFICYPGDYRNVVSVMSLVQNGDGTIEHSFMSNQNAPGSRDKNISAPGGRIMSTIPNGGYDYSTGTSMAAPQVSGILALEFAANPKLTADQAIQALYDGAVDLGAEGFDEMYGYGMANAYGAVTRAKNAQGSAGTSRIAGDDRYGTMRELTNRAFSTSGYAVVTTGADFPDALSASVLAGARKAPVLITNSNYLNIETKSELTRLKVAHVYIVGGSSAVSDTVEAEIRSMGIDCIRVAGANRQATSLEVLRCVHEMGVQTPTVVVATGNTFPDSLSISPWCYQSGTPIILTQSDGTLSPDAVNAISQYGVRRAVLLGGNSAVKDAVIEQVGQSVTCERIAGADRYQTSAEICNFELRNGFGWQQPLTATGRNYPDALCGAPLAATYLSPLLLVADQNSPTVALLRTNKASIASVHVVGGPSAISDSLAQAILSAVK